MGGLYDAATLRALVQVLEQQPVLLCQHGHRAMQWIRDPNGPVSAWAAHVDAADLACMLEPTQHCPCAPHICINHESSGVATCPVRTPGVEPGSQAWEACMMPLHYVRLYKSLISDYSLRANSGIRACSGRLIPMDQCQPGRSMSVPLTLHACSNRASIVHARHTCV